MKQLPPSNFSFVHAYTAPIHRRLALRAALSGLFFGAGLLAGCGSSPSKSHRRTVVRPKPQPITPRKGALHFPANMREQVVARALFLINTPYRYGGNSPSAGFDCSGFVQYVFSAFSTKPLPRTARQWAQASTPIRKAYLQRGDLVFFNTSGRSYSHMGIYIGRGRFVHAPSSGKVVSIARLDMKYYLQRFEGARTVYS